MNGTRESLNMNRCLAFAGALALVGCGWTSEDSAASPTGGATDSTGLGQASNSSFVEVNRPAEPVRIEESDIVKVHQSSLYVLNVHTGFNVIDASRPESPRLLSRLEALASAQGELYAVEDGVLALVVDSKLECHSLAPAEFDDYSSTAVAAIASPEDDPNVVVDRCLPGALVESRLVGDKLYVVTTAAPTEPNRGWIFSLDASDVAELEVVDSVALQGSAFEVHVTDSRVYVAEQQTSSTRVKAFDISEGDGLLDEGDSVLVAGTPAGRFHMDEYAGTFRIVTRDASENSTHLHVLDASEATDLTVMASLDDLAPGEELFATRFVDDFAYVVTYQPEVIVDQETVTWGEDPLWVISLEEPKRPRVLGMLEIPGWSDFIFPRGDLLLAVGRGESGSRVAASLFDVSDPLEPTELRRLEFGADGASSEANSDFRAVRIIDEGLGDVPLVVVPYSNNNLSTGGCIPQHFIQLIDLEDRDLQLQGTLREQGRVLRTLPVEGQLYSVTTQHVNAHGVTDRSSPSTHGGVVVGDLQQPDECILPPTEPQRFVDRPVFGVDSMGDDVGPGDDVIVGCSVRPNRATRGHTGLAWLWLGMLLVLGRRAVKHHSGAVKGSGCSTKENLRENMS